MNTISKIHQCFSEFLTPKVLEYPEDYLGPNYEAVLNFWLHWDDLTEEELKVVEKHEWHFYKNNLLEWRTARDLAWNSSRKVLGGYYAYEAKWAAYTTTLKWVAFYATLELIGMHLIIDKQKPLTFFEMFLDL